MLIAPVVNNSGKRGCGVLWKYYGKCAAQPRRMRMKGGAGGTKKGRLEEKEMANTSQRESSMM